MRRGLQEGEGEDPMSINFNPERTPSRAYIAADGFDSEMYFMYLRKNGRGGEIGQIVRETHVAREFQAARHAADQAWQAEMQSVRERPRTVADIYGLSGFRLNIRTT
jgi:hypothetical protein